MANLAHDKVSARDPKGHGAKTAVFFHTQTIY